MKSHLKFLAIVLALLLAPALALCAPAAKTKKAVFISVKGKVEVKRTGAKPRTVKKDSTVSEGDRVVASQNGNAVLRLFDGTELTIHPGTEIGISRLADAGVDKTLRFKLLLGKVLAKVKKLASPRSSFEIEAGGVVCGVRGTEYSVAYDPDTGKVDIFVVDGNVWASCAGETFQYGPGNWGHFTDGKPEGGHEPETRGGHGGGTNPFHGMNGVQQDSFGSLTDLSGGSEGVAGQTLDDNLQGLGAHTVILLFDFPESP